MTSRKTAQDEENYERKIAVNYKENSKGFMKC